MVPTNAIANFDVAIIGMGVRSIAHFILEALDTLEECRGVRRVHRPAGRGRFRHFGFFVSARRRIAPAAESLSRAYRKDRKHIKNYGEAAGIVLDALEAERPIAYLTPGNPVTFDRVAQEILQGEADAGLSAFVVPGVSSVDTVLVDLQQELHGDADLQGVLVRGHEGCRPDTRLSCLLLQTSLFATNFR